MAKYEFIKMIDQTLEISKLKKIASEIKKETVSHEKDGVFGNQNCLLCAFAFEMQLRGKKTLPRPVLSPRDKIFNEKKYNNIVLNSRKIKFENIKEIKKILSVLDSRYYCHVQWKNSEGGHEFLLINLNGQIYILDGQAGYVDTIDNSKKYFDINFENSYVIRIDNKEINNDFIELNKKKNMTKLDLDKDLKYLKENNMISEEDYYSRLVKDSVLDSSKTDFISMFGEKEAKRYFEACKNPQMNNVCKNIEIWNKYFRMAQKGELSLLKFEDFIEDINVYFEENIEDHFEHVEEGYENLDYYVDDVPTDYNQHVFINTDGVEKLLNYTIEKYQSEEARRNVEIEEICEMPEADDVNYLGEDNGWKCYEILSPEASVKYGLVVGGKAKWCISGGYFNGGNNEGGILEEAKHYFNQHLRSEYETYYFIIGHGTKFAICPTDGDECTIWNQNDDDVYASEIKEPPIGIKELAPYIFVFDEEIMDEVYAHIENVLEENGFCIAEEIEEIVEEKYNEKHSDGNSKIYARYTNELLEEVVSRIGGMIYSTWEEYYTSDDYKDTVSEEEYDAKQKEYFQKELVEAISKIGSLKGFDIIMSDKLYQLPDRILKMLQQKCLSFTIEEFEKSEEEVFQTIQRINAKRNQKNCAFFRVTNVEETKKEILNFTKDRFLTFGNDLEKPFFVLVRYTYDDLNITEYDDVYGLDNLSIMENCKLISVYSVSRNGYIHMYENAVATLPLAANINSIYFKDYEDYIRNIKRGYVESKEDLYKRILERVAKIIDDWKNEV